jgi:hypothetical protein
MIFIIYIAGIIFGWWAFSWWWLVIILLLESANQVTND